jgi:hypothetical protein
MNLPLPKPRFLPPLGQSAQQIEHPLWTACIGSKLHPSSRKSE